MAKQYGYAVKIEAWIAVDPENDEASQKAMTARAHANKALVDAGFTVTSKGKFGSKAAADTAPKAA